MTPSLVDRERTHCIHGVEGCTCLDVLDELEAAPSAARYRSTVTDEPLTDYWLVECPECEGAGEVSLEWRDAHTKRLVQEVETCPTCRGHGLVEQRLTHGAYLPYPVEPIGAREEWESEAEVFGGGS